MDAYDRRFHFYYDDRTPKYPTTFGWDFVLEFCSFHSIVNYLAYYSFSCRQYSKGEKAIHLFFAGYSPWYVWLICIEGLCLFSPSVHLTFGWLIKVWLLQGSALGLFLWSTIINFAFFRNVLYLSSFKATQGLILYLGSFWGVLLGFFWFTNQLEPRLHSML